MMRIKRKGLTLTVFEDDIESPREYYKDDNKTKMICFHRKYNLGDEHAFDTPKEFAVWVSHNKDNIAYIKPLYLLDHSDLYLSTKDFFDPWDSGQIGYVYIPKSKVKDITDKKVLDEIVEDEVKAYADWLIGNPQYFAFEITDENDCTIESMGVFELTTEKEMFNEMKERSEHKYDFIFDALLSAQENCL